MTMVGTADTPTAPALRRARIACKACNARRVKCDAADGQPCWHCRTRQTPCELIESRRGKYVRQQNRQPRRKPTSQLVREAPRHLSEPLDRASVDGASSKNSEPHHKLTFEDEQPATDSERGHQTEAYRSLTDESHNDVIRPADQLLPHIRPFYLGDLQNLSYTVELVCYARDGVTEPMTVRYPIPAALTDRSIFKTGPGVGEQALLQEALTMPAREISDQLVRSFFEVCHPAYPVVDRVAFLRLYEQGEASPLLLHAIFLVALTSGNEKLVQAAGYADRTTARKTHYLRAKALYDVDYEPEQSKIAAALHLLGFWWAGPDDQKDSWYWQGCSVTVAHSLGMHRSAHCELSTKSRSLRKRIWWSIYIRDRVAAAALGRPCRIRDEDCDIELPSKEDLDVDEDHDHTLIPAQEDYHVLYFLEMSKLATIVGDVIIAEFSPRRSALEKYDANVLGNRLSEWETQLPDILRPQPATTTLGPPFWAGMLNAFYQNTLILLFRPKSIENLSMMEVERDMRARRAADFITRAAEDLLAAGTIKHAQIHLVPALFGALSIHTLVICRKDPIHRQLAENKSRQCMLALSELAKSWPVGMWIVKSFLNLMKRLTGQGSTSGGSKLSITSCVTTGDGATASLLDHGSLATRHSAIGSTGHVIYSNQIGLNGSEVPMRNSSVGNSLGTQHREQQPSEYYVQASDQLVYDSFWLGCLDHTFDFDSFQAGLSPVAPLSFDDSNP